LGVHHQWLGRSWRWDSRRCSAPWRAWRRWLCSCSSWWCWLRLFSSSATPFGSALLVVEASSSSLASSTTSRGAWLGGLSEVFFSIFIGPSVYEVAPRTFCLLCFGGGGGLFRSSVGLLSAADFLSSSLLRKRAADTCSSSKLRLGVGSRRRLLRHLQGLASLVKVGDGVGFASSFLRRAGAPVGRFGVVLCNSRFSQGASCKVGCTVLCFNINPFFRKKCNLFFI
jgi:hypothetical protein